MIDAQTTLPGGVAPFVYPAPPTADAWDETKPMLRKQLRRLLGDLPEMFTPKPLTTSVEARDGYTLEKFYFDNRAGCMVFGYLAIPQGRSQPGPAVVYHHYHGGEYSLGKDGLLASWITENSPAKDLTDAGYVVLAIDAYGFGERQSQGPAGGRESGRQTEEALFKTFLWQGKTLWGMMVRDDQLALNYLISRKDIVDPERIGAVGMSMGSTRTWWLSALDERVKASVCVACLTRYQTLIQAGEVNQHGIYYYAPNLLYEGIDMEAVVGCVAPRALLTLTGDQDGGSPVEGVNQINSWVGDIYNLYNQPENFKGIVYEGVGHTYTVEMWNETLAWFDKHLGLE